MTEPTVLVDPLCLCQRPHPCPLHGAWTHIPPTNHLVELDGGWLLHLLDNPEAAA